MANRVLSHGQFDNDASLDMGRPPQTSRAYSRTGRAALTAGTLGTVGDHTARENVQRDVEVRDADGYDANVMPRTVSLDDFDRALGIPPTDHEPREWYDEAERQSRLRRWQAIR